MIKLVNSGDRSRLLAAVCSTRPADPAIRGLLEPDVPYFECQGRGGNDPGVVLALWRVFRRFRPDIVHTHSWGTLIEGLLAARLAGVPHVVHGEHGTLQTRPYQLWIQRMAWGRADRVLSVSSRLAETLARRVGFDGRRIQTIRNGVNLDRFGPHRRIAGRRALGIADDAIAVGTVGRLVPVKDQATLMRAFAQVARQQPRVVLLFAGDGPLGGELEALAGELGIRDRVRFLGHRADVEDVLAALDVFVLSSVSEGMSNTILEAMASGVAVVATHVGGADELVVDGETGVLVPAADAPAMAEALAVLTGNAAVRERMANSGLARARREFTLDRMVAGYESVYRELSGESTPSAARARRRRGSPAAHSMAAPSAPRQVSTNHGD